MSFYFILKFLSNFIKLKRISGNFFAFNLDLFYRLCDVLSEVESGPIFFQLTGNVLYFAGAMFQVAMVLF